MLVIFARRSIAFADPQHKGHRVAHYRQVNNKTNSKVKVIRNSPSYIRAELLTFATFPSQNRFGNLAHIRKSFNSSRSVLRMNDLLINPMAKE